MKTSPAKGKRPPKKGLRGRMPVKRSINLMLVDENKINPMKAVPAIILIVLLAAAFSKFLVVDRLAAMSAASGRVSGLRSDLEQASQAIQDYEGVEDRYAHLTYAGMTQEELDRVDRVKILELVSTILPEGDAVQSWSVTSNILTVDITGNSLQDLNELARKIEESPIVDICSISTAKKDTQSTTRQVLSNNSVSDSLVGALEARRREAENGFQDFVLGTLTNIVRPAGYEEVDARFTIFLVQPPEAEETPEVEQGEEAEAQEAQDAGDSEQPEAAERAEIKKPSRPSRSGAVQATAEPEEVSAP